MVSFLLAVGFPPGLFAFRDSERKKPIWGDSMIDGFGVTKRDIGTIAIVAALVLVLIGWGVFELGRALQDREPVKIPQPYPVEKLVEVEKEVVVFENVTVPFGEHVDRLLREKQEMDAAVKKWQEANDGNQ